MATAKKSSKSNKKKAPPKVADLKFKKDVKGGVSGTDGKNSNRRGQLVRYCRFVARGPARLASATLAIILSLSSAAASEIREFNVATLERLGRELSRRDGIAARATDLVLEEYPIARSLKMRGWITELKKSRDAVHFIAETPSGPTLAYTVNFSGSGKPKVQDMRGRPLPQEVAVQYKARNTAVAAVQGRLFDINYNFEVLDDPDGRGFLVYALGATATPGQVVLAGHLRVTVSPEGTKAERVDALSQSLLLSSDKESGLPKGYKPVGLYFNQIVSNKPVETLVYTSNLAKKNIYVGTPDGKMWIVGRGKMQVNRSKPSDKTEAGIARKAMGR